MLELVPASLSMDCADLLPNTIDISNFICKELFIVESLHYSLYLDIAAGKEELHSFLDLSLPL